MPEPHRRSSCICWKSGARRLLPVGGRAEPRYGAVGRTRCVDKGCSAVGERDFPLRLLAPSRLSAATTSWSRQVLRLRMPTGRCRGVLVGGHFRVGQRWRWLIGCALVVTGNDGWFPWPDVRPASAGSGVRRHLQAFHALGRLLLAEPEDELAEPRNGSWPHWGRMRAWSPRRCRVLGAAGAAPVRRSADRLMSGCSTARRNATCGGWPRGNDR